MFVDNPYAITTSVGLAVTYFDTKSALTFPDTNSASLDQIIHCPPLSNVIRIMQQQHPTFTHENKQEIVKELLKSMSLPVPDAEKLRFLNEPVFEILRVFAAEKQNNEKLPNKGELICATTATANSGNENEAKLALDIIGSTPVQESTILSTVKEDGKTGVSNVRPRHDAVKFNHTAPFEKWNEFQIIYFSNFVPKLTNRTRQSFIGGVFHKIGNQVHKIIW
jgi:hypothetical protein